MEIDERNQEKKRTVSIAKKFGCRFGNRFAKKKTRREGGNGDKTNKL